MKKKILIIAAAAALLMTGCNADPNAPTGMKTASGEGADYTLFVPEDWTVDITTGATGAYYSNADTSGVLVTTWDLPHTDTTLDEWWETNLQEIQSVYQDVQVEGSENILIDGNHGVKYTWTGTLGCIPTASCRRRPQRTAASTCSRIPPCPSCTNPIWRTWIRCWNFG